MEFNEKTVDSIIQEHGFAYLDQYVARTFHQVSGRPEMEVLNVLRVQYNQFLADESGHNKHARAIHRACDTLANGWTQGLEVRTHSAAEIIARYDIAFAYGVFVRRGN